MVLGGKGMKKIVCDSCLDCAYDEQKHYSDVEGYCDFDNSSEFIEDICKELGDTLPDHECYNIELEYEMAENKEVCVCACNKK